MIDLHCHFLPGIDDGPDSMDESLALARLAVEKGITHSIVTPHIHPGRWNNEVSLISSSLESFKRSIKDAGIPLIIGMSGEMRVGLETLQMVANHQVPFLGKWGEYYIVLLEMPHNHIPTEIKQMIEWLMKRNIRPLIAHPERNKEILRRVEKIQPLVDLGCLFQVTAGSVAGKFGFSAKNRSRQLLEMGIVTVLASDAHNVKRRPPILDEGRDAAAAIVGTKMANKLVLDNPWKIVSCQFE
ncbi:capsular biosynthesis protein [Candidatus Endobugula sertula]|uniref:protein-tyrosine-phosphatase n=1 Tax=Candidatus Endobugula sertula TaxID=62101 RepID=A0A1D2QNJ1_9GAMM|nr:capsular biosynthesis protein [Candidatus Endobugula sertula]